MTVFVAHAPDDRSTAEALEKVIERRGQFVELDDGATALRPIRGGDVLVLLVSQALMFATARLRIEQRALEAWAEGRLIVVRLDKGIAPVGLRDLPAIDASFAAQREFKWNEVAEQVREKLKPQAPPADSADAGPLAAPNKKKGGGALWWILGLIALALLSPFAFVVMNQSAQVIVEGPAPIDVVALAMFAGGALAVLSAAALGIRALLRMLQRRRREPAASAPARRTDEVFVSYARANENLVLPVIEAAKRAGRRFWVDQKGGVGAGDGWAGEIVRAIRGSASVVVMCSKAAFESDHVKREVYLADRYKKKLAPVFVEAAEPPEDFEYFFAGVQPLRLFETPEAERPQALIRVLG
jgi:hypothetical protein